ncbi:MAG: hypothetical protein DBX47_07405 [Clostridiales bacterium]|nr:MAG: hypothetical protein DBX47_07405 [Clostridiales bacterium]
MKKVVSTILLVALCLSGSLFIRPANNMEAKSEIDQLRDQLKKLQQEQSQIEKQKDSISNEIDSLLSKKSSMDEELHVTNEQINVYEKIVDNIKKQIAVKEAEIEELQAEHDEYVRKFQQRARESYERGETSYLSMIVGSEDISQMMAKIDLMKQVSEYENTLLAKIEEDAKAVKELKAELDAQKAEQQKHLNDLESAKQRQRSTMNNIQSAISTLESNQESLAAQQKKYEEMEAELDKKISQLASSSGQYSGDELIWPVPGYSSISSGYGYREFDNAFHYGIDIPAAKGTPIVAVEKGTIIYAKWVTTGGGMKIVIDHGSGLVTNYNHLSGFAVSSGQTVSKGQVIGYVGSTGFSTGNHLDFRIIHNGSFYNPTDYINPSNSKPKKSIKDLIG